MRNTMLYRAAALTALMLIPACAGASSAGRSAAPPPPAAVEAPALPAPTPQPTPPSAAAPGVSVATPAPRASAAAENDIVVPGQTRRQIPPPGGDPRTMTERRQDVRAWDECVSEAQTAFDSDPMRPQMQSPEETCRSTLGMVDRESVPQSRPRR
jgi:hypothetical protein